MSGAAAAAAIEPSRTSRSVRTSRWKGRRVVLARAFLSHSDADEAPQHESWQTRTEDQVGASRAARSPCLPRGSRPPSHPPSGRFGGGRSKLRRPAVQAEFLYVVDGLHPS